MVGQVGAQSAPACRGCGLPPWRLTRNPPTPYTPAQLAAVFSQFRLVRRTGKTPPTDRYLQTSGRNTDISETSELEETRQIQFPINASGLPETELHCCCL